MVVYAGGRVGGSEEINAFFLANVIAWINLFDSNIPCQYLSHVNKLLAGKRDGPLLIPICLPAFSVCSLICPNTNSINPRSPFVANLDAVLYASFNFAVW